MLDPNNYRFIDNKDYVFVENESIKLKKNSRKNFQFVNREKMKIIFQIY